MFSWSGIGDCLVETVLAVNGTNILSKTLMNMISVEMEEEKSQFQNSLMKFLIC